MRPTRPRTTKRKPGPTLSDLVGLAHRRAAKLAEALVAIQERAERDEAELVHLRAGGRRRQSA